MQNIRYKKHLPFEYLNCTKHDFLSNVNLIRNVRILTEHLILTGLLSSDDAAVWGVQPTSVSSKVTLSDEKIRSSAKCYNIWLLQSSSVRSSLAIGHE